MYTLICSSYLINHQQVIEVEVVDPIQKRKLLIPWNDHINTAQWLSDEITNRCWMAFGKWVSHLLSVTINRIS